MNREGTASTVAMSPVEGPVAVVQPGVMEQQHQQQGGGQVGPIMKKTLWGIFILKVSLSVLIEMIVQRTYHELSILAELLPRQVDLNTFHKITFSFD